ncbi:tyrosine-protein phosphatase [Hyphomicrobium sp.]|uniref:tyrosine-protein phosphatase n=1 Tax=Hyphomicrobium sp. TaxID=82 RepID=UPI002D76660B|nr:tyrosine-protein phosphatase [Hyphomicrobium sp.]HET6388778.1 tyrosine-protein phosphatase [Hyphomicrobium sp.]
MPKRSLSFARGILVVLGVFVATAAAYAGVQFGRGNFHEVVAGELYRSGQPRGGDIDRYVHDYGIKSVLNLRGANPDKRWYRDEMAAISRNGLAHADLALKADRALDDETVSQLFALFASLPKPLLIHCDGGADRTGLASALYLAWVKHADEWSAELQLSILYGHIGLPLTHGWAMSTTFERLEPRLGYPNS